MHIDGMAYCSPLAVCCAAIAHRAASRKAGGACHRHCNAKMELMWRKVFVWDQGGREEGKGVGGTVGSRWGPGEGRGGLE